MVADYGKVYGGFVHCLLLDVDFGVNMGLFCLVLNAGETGGRNRFV